MVGRWFEFDAGGEGRAVSVWDPPLKILADGGKLRHDPPIWDDPAGQSRPLGTQLNEIMSMTSMNLTAVFMKVPEGYVAFIEELPGANTQGTTLDEARANLHEAVALVLDANRAMSEQSLEGAAVIRETFVLPAA
jgi:predicted RNase H-like HicB family nuclease